MWDECDRKGEEEVVRRHPGSVAPHQDTGDTGAVTLSCGDTAPDRRRHRAVAASCAGFGGPLASVDRTQQLRAEQIKPSSIL